MAFTIPLRRFRRPLRPAPAVLVRSLCWSVYLLALLHLGLAWMLLAQRVSLPTAHGIALRLLQPVGLLGVIGVTILTVLQHPPGHRRWAWVCFLVSRVLTLVTTLITITGWQPGDPPDSRPVTTGLFLATYTVGLIAVVLYFPRRSWWLATTTSTLLDSTIVGLATWVSLTSLLHPTSQLPALTTAMSVGILFAFMLVTLQYAWPRGGAFRIFVLLSLICLGAGNAIWLVIDSRSGMQPWFFLIAPLFTLHNGLLAQASWMSCMHPPPADAPSSPLPHAFPGRCTVQWLLSMSVPRLITMVALIVAGVTGPGIPWTGLCILVMLTMLREIHLALTYDYRLRGHERLRQRVTALQHVLAQVLHDLGTPLHGALTLLQHGCVEAFRPLVADQIDQLRDLREHVQYYLHVQQTPLQRTVVSVETLCAAAVTAVADRAARRRVQVHLRIADPEPTARADPTALRRVLDLLLLTAVQAAPRDGHLCLAIPARSGPSDRNLVLVITEIGYGAARDDCESVVVPAGAADEPQAGAHAGLRLTMVQEVLHRMHGACAVTHQPGGGRSFILQLPRASRPAQTDVVSAAGGPPHANHADH